PTGASTTTGAGSFGAPSVGGSGSCARWMPRVPVGVSSSAIQSEPLQEGGRGGGAWRVRVDEFDFERPPDLIAQQAAPRGESRLLVVDRATGKLSHAPIRDLPSFLRGGDLLVTNDTRVFPARLIGRRVPSGGAVECLLLSNSEPPGSDSPPPASET